MYIRRLFRPRVVGLVVGGLGNYIGRKGVYILSLGGIRVGRLISRYGVREVLVYGNLVKIDLGRWFNVGNFSLNWGLRYDGLSIIIVSLVMRVSTLVHIYSLEYMKDDPHLVRFIMKLSRFTFFMLVLLTADNYLQRFLGWEGVGLCSYMLINFWYTRLQANKSGIKAMIFNRVGDIGRRLGIIRLYVELGGREFGRVFSMRGDLYDKTVSLVSFEVSLVNLIGLLIRLGVMGKSAQLGLHLWLPDAMEGPTPVSALIHAATMVTAGVYRLIRTSMRFEISQFRLDFIVFRGGLTSRYGGIVGVFQHDIKRIIAYSTCSQLGYMVMVCGMSGYDLGRFHLINHGRFKALLFLSAGVIIHGMGDEQDIRRIGGLLKVIPVVGSRMIIGLLALIGFPFRTGFYSKDVLRERIYGGYTWVSQIGARLGYLGSLCTGRYSYRRLYYIFIGEAKGYKKVYESAHEGGWILMLPLYIRGFGSLIGGWFRKDRRIGPGIGSLGGAIYIDPLHMIRFDSENRPLLVKIFPVRISLGGGLVYIRLLKYKGMYLDSLKMGSINYLYYYMNKKFFFDKLYIEFIGSLGLRMGYKYVYKLVDRGVIEYRGPYGRSKLGTYCGDLRSKLQTGKVYNYILVMFILYVLIIIKAIFGGVDLIIDTRLVCILAFRFEV